jgi:hypothetical protein
MSLSGSLSEFSLSDVLTLLNQQKKSGSLAVVNGKNKARLLIERGAVVEAGINQRTPETVLRDVLKAQGRLTAAQFRSLASLAGTSGRTVAELLVSKGVLSEDEARDWFQIAAEELVFELITWKQGAYQFKVQAMPKNSRVRPFELKPDFIILEGLRQMDEWPMLKEKIPPPDSVFKIKKADYGEYDLGTDAHIITLLDGVSNLAEVRKKSPYGDFRFYSALISLWDEGFVDKRMVAQKQKKTWGVLGALRTWAAHAPLSAAFCFFVLVLVLRLGLNHIWRGPQSQWESSRRAADKIMVESFAADYAVSYGRQPRGPTEVMKTGNLKLRERARLRGIISKEKAGDQ